MLRSIRQQCIAIGLVFLFVGPTSMSLLHEHAAEPGEHCTELDEQHLHSFAASSNCFICFFSFTTFQVDRPVSFSSFVALQLPAEPLPGYRIWHTLLLSFDHAPRGPPHFGNSL